jgi:hypothetical protein
LSIINVRQIRNFLQTDFLPEIDVSDIPSSDEVNPLSRALAAYSINLLSHATNKEAALSVVDGANDNGIDAVYVDETTNRLYVVQSKWIDSGTGEPDSGSIEKFTSGVVDLINLKFDRFNQKVRSLEPAILQALTNPSFRMSVVLTYTSMKELSEHSSRKLKDLIEMLNDASEMVELVVLLQSHLYRGLTAGLKGDPIDLEINLASWGKKNDPFPAWYGQVNANQIVDWWNTHHDQLFSSNLRGLLADTEINSEIRASLIESPDLFWYFNNGITIVAESINRPLAGSGNQETVALACKNISIVNGAQTVGTIGRTASQGLYTLEEVTVPVRLIEIGHEGSDFGRRITRSNNRQNRIEARDFVALDDQQIRLQEELLVDGISYQLMRQGGFAASDTAFDVVESTVALACASGDGSLAVQAKREISKFWEDMNSHLYKRLFNPATSSIYLWRCVQAQRVLDNAISTLLESASGSLQVNGVLVHGNRIIASLVFQQIKTEQFRDIDFPFTNSVTDQLIYPLCKDAAERLSLVSEENYPRVALATLFKNATRCKELIGIYNNDAQIASQLPLLFSDVEG